jgi:creatinine amidohydrolase
MGGLDMPATVQIEPELTWDNNLLRPWLEKLCSEFHRLGFKAIIILTGHYGHNQQIAVREVAVRMTERLQIPVFGTPEYWLAQDAGYLGDHAGIGETSILWHLCPDLVAIDRIRDDPDYGKDGRIEAGSSPELGKKYVDLIVDRLAQLARSMPGWNLATREAFVRSERALISVQLRGWRSSGNQWRAWRKMFSGEITNYGELLVQGRFSEIEKMASKLIDE